MLIVIDENDSRPIYRQIADEIRLLRILPNLTHIFTPITENPVEAAKISSELLRTLQDWSVATLVK